MTRKEKYPETSTFHYHNENIKNRITTDCVYRAVSRATGIGYASTIYNMANMQVETGYDACSNEGINKYLSSLGWQKMKQPKKLSGSKYTGKEFCEKLQRKGNSKNIVANLGGYHVVAIVDNKVNDIWDSTSKCIGNYWIKL